MTEFTLVIYEYKEVAVDAGYAELYRDGYRAFGWQCDQERVQTDVGEVVTLHMKRDRRIMNRVELTRLQRQFEACVGEICMLERSKSDRATAAALVCGVVGAAFAVPAIFAAIATPPKIWLCVLMAIPAIAEMALALPVYRHIMRSRGERVEPLIEAKYDEIYTVFEKARRLLAG